MSVFRSEQEVYAHIGRLFEEMCEDDDLVRQFQRADAIIQYRCHAPAATITADLRAEAEPAVHLGPCDLLPDVVMEMAADTAHRFFLGEVNLAVALARREISASGPVGKILKLVPLVKPFFPRYRALLASEGRRDLVPA